MRAGRLDKRASFVRKGTQQDSYGQPQQTTTPLFDRWAAIRPLAGREYFAAQSENSEITTEIRVRFDTQTRALTTADQVQHGGLTYDIESIINPNLENKELILMCTVRSR